MKTNKKAGIVALTALVAVGSYFIAGTYAKYTSSVSGDDTVGVAKWSWIIDDEVIDTFAETKEGGHSSNYTFNLFDTLRLYDTDGNANCTSQTAESDVDESGDPLIAPGTCGQFNLVIKNRSEVNATYAVTFAETNNSNIPIEYSTNGADWTTVSTLNVASTAIDMDDGTEGSGNDEVTVPVYWRWQFERGSGDTLVDNNNDDTALGFAANAASRPEVTVTATVTVTQVD